jgi:hypothetical protein
MDLDFISSPKPFVDGSECHSFHLEQEYAVDKVSQTILSLFYISNERGVEHIQAFPYNWLQYCRSKHNPRNNTGRSSKSRASATFIDSLGECSRINSGSQGNHSSDSEYWF